MEKGVSILDVAKRAGVSPSTVSHALNGKRPVNNATKERIYQAIEELGYVASYTASHLKGGKSGLIGCYVADVTESFTAYMLKGIEHAIKGTGYSLILGSGTEIGTGYSEIANYFRKYDVEGFLLINHLSSVMNVDFKLNISTPMVLVNSELSGYHCVLPSNRTAGARVATHLYEVGVRNPLLLGGPRERLSVARRFAGFAEKYKELGITIAEDHIVYGEFTYESGYEMMKQAIADKIAFDGLFCANDYIALGAMKYLQENDIRVPEDIKVAGFDNRDVSKYCNIPVTTVDQNLEEVGRLAFDRLVSIIAEDIVSEPAVLRAEPILVVRASSATN